MTLGRIILDPVKTPGICHVPGLSNESANIASRCLQANRSANHIFTTSEKEMGLFLHNHVVYHVLTLFALGASPQTILSQTKRNFEYQLLPPKFPDEGTVSAMADPTAFKEFVGKEDYFLDFCEFFEREIEKYGYEDVLQKYLLGDNPIAKDIFPRMYHGYVHGIMHIGLGIEFKQMPILAEGLAEAAVHHDTYYTQYIEACASEAQKALENPQSLIACFEESLLDPKITTCSSYDYCRQYQPPSEEFPEGRWFVTREPYRDGVVGLVKNELARIVAKWRVSPDDDLERATAELINVSSMNDPTPQSFDSTMFSYASSRQLIFGVTIVYIAAAAQRAPYEPRYDFFLIHGSNACLWHSVFLAEPSITRAQKAHLIETTGRMLLFLWAGMGCPRPNMDYMMAHEPKIKDCGWDKIFERACLHEDDGHMIKLIRALKNGETVCKPYDHLPEFPMKQNMFLHAANAAMDSGSEKPMVYVQHFDLIRFAGFEEAWEKVPLRCSEAPSRSSITATPLVGKI